SGARAISGPHSTATSPRCASSNAFKPQRKSGHGPTPDDQLRGPVRGSQRSAHDSPAPVRTDENENSTRWCACRPLRPVFGRTTTQASAHQAEEWLERDRHASPGTSGSAEKCGGSGLRADFEVNRLTSPANATGVLK